jgi:hypothetical protein
MHIPWKTFLHIHTHIYILHKYKRIHIMLKHVLKFKMVIDSQIIVITFNNIHSIFLYEYVHNKFSNPYIRPTFTFNTSYRYIDIVTHPTSHCTNKLIIIVKKKNVKKLVISIFGIIHYYVFLFVRNIFLNVTLNTFIVL